MKNSREDLNPGIRILGLDYGRRRIGLALSDPTGLLSQGAGVLINDGKVMDHLRKMVAERGVGKIVVGMPYRSDGSKGESGREVDAFVEAIRKSISLPVESWDESFTTAEAQRIFLETGMRKKKRQEKGRRDEMAARLLLQDYLNARGTRENP